MRIFSFLPALGLIANMQAAQAQSPDPQSRSPIGVLACGNYSVYGRVVAPNVIALKGFGCLRDGKPLNVRDLQIGTCPVAALERPDMKQQISPFGGRFMDCKYTVRMGVSLADPDEAAQMQTGRLVRLSGDFLIVVRNRAVYLVADAARVTGA